MYLNTVIYKVVDNTVISGIQYANINTSPIRLPLYQCCKLPTPPPVYSLYRHRLIYFLLLVIAYIS